jgi:hypothetical protein
MKIYYSQDVRIDQGRSELAQIEPVNLLDDLKKYYNNNNEYFKCYAAIEMLKNIYVIKSEIDLEVKITKNDIITYGKLGNHPEFYQTFYQLGSPPNTDVVMMGFDLFTFSQESVIASQYPAFLHPNCPFYNTGMTIAPGEFDISKWFRPMVAGLINQDVEKEKTIKIKRGDPLYYVKFNTNKRVKLERFELNEKLHYLLNNCVRLKTSLSKRNLSIVYDLFLRKNYNKRIIKEIKKNITY